MATLDILANASLWAAVLRIATPLLFGTLGALLCERVGVLNLGIEGIMTFGAMIGWLTVYEGGSLWLGMMAAFAGGALFGLLHGALTVSLGLSQHVTGLGITLFASSFTYYVYRLVIPVSGSPPTIVPFQPLAIPGLSSLPFLGEALFSQAAPTLRSVSPYCWPMRSPTRRLDSPSVSSVRIHTPRRRRASIRSACGLPSSRLAAP
jgi:general nucleoside transport system permease protein